jgi:hypothetical protein
MRVEKPSKIALVHENLCPVVRRFKYRHEETTTIKMQEIQTTGKQFASVISAVASSQLSSSVAVVWTSMA